MQRQDNFRWQDETASGTGAIRVQAVEPGGLVELLRNYSGKNQVGQAILDELAGHSHFEPDWPPCSKTATALPLWQSLLRGHRIC